MNNNLNLIERTNFNMCLLLANYIEMNKDPMIHKYDCYQSTVKITFIVLLQIYYLHVNTN